MLLKCCLLHIDMILPWHLLDLVYLCLSLHQGLFISCGCDNFFFIIFIFIIIDHNLITTDMIIFLHILFSSSQKFSVIVLLKFCLIFCHFQLGVPYKVLHVYFHLPLTQFPENLLLLVKLTETKTSGLSEKNKSSFFKCSHEIQVPHLKLRNLTNSLLKY